MRIKRLLALVLTVVMFASLCVFASAEETAAPTGIKYGTPTVDGEIDEAYKSSISFKMAESQIWFAEPTLADFTKHNGTAYLLWDADYLYVAVDVVDCTVVSQGETWLGNAKASDTWQNDCAEIWITIGSNKNKVQMDAYNYKPNAQAKDENNALIVDANNSEFAATITDTGYIVEAAVKFTSDVTLEAELAVALGLQINDISDTEGTWFAEWGGNAYGNENTLSTTLLACAHETTEVVEAVEADCANPGYTGDLTCTACGTVVEEGEEIAATGEHTYADGVCSVCGAEEGSAETGDALVISAAALAVACGAAVVFATRKKKED